MDSVRIDKYLWSIRVFKTRTDATDACNGNRVQINGVNAKASKAVKVGDEISARKNNVLYRYRVLALAENRMGAALVPQYADNLTPFNIITLVISVFPVPFCVYYCTKFLLMKSNGDSMLIGVKPLNFSTLLICFGILFYNYFRITDNKLGMDIAFGVYSLCIAAEVFLADWGRKRWQS